MLKPNPHQSIFRANALKHYLQSGEKTALPRFINLPTALLLWLLLALLLLEGALAWSDEIPMYISVQGIVLAADQHYASADHDDAFALVFLAPGDTHALRPGSPVRVHIGQAGPPVSSEIVRLEPGITSPFEACQRYHLGDSCALLVPQPSIVVLVRIKGLSATTYAGSQLTAEIQVGSQRIITLIPGIGELVGR
jgi:hypothetical protein